MQRPISLVLPHPLSEALKALSELEGVNLFTLLLAAFKTLLYRYTEQDDILVGIRNTNTQSESRLIRTVTLILRTNISGNPSFRELLNRVHRVTLAANTHQDLPFEDLVEELQLELGRYSPFQVMFQLDAHPKQAAESQGLKIEDQNRNSESPCPSEITLKIVETEGLTCLFQYNTNLFETTTIERMLGHYRTLLAGIVANPEQQILNLPLLTEAEKHQILVEWNNTTISYPQHQCVHELIEVQAEQISTRSR